MTRVGNQPFLDTTTYRNLVANACGGVGGIIDRTKASECSRDAAISNPAVRLLRAAASVRGVVLATDCCSWREVEVRATVDQAAHRQIIAHRGGCRASRRAPRKFVGFNRGPGTPRQRRSRKFTRRVCLLPRQFVESEFARLQVM